MKKLFSIQILLIITALIFAQVPEKMSYQAVVRDASGVLLSNSAIGMQISILQGSATGTPVYVETQTPVTNDNGLVSIEIGDGTPITGTFAEIDWSSGIFFIKTETDPSGGTSYSISGTSQMLSVPYALFAKTAENVDFTEVDGSITNEIQTISKSGSIVTLSEAGGSYTDSVNTYVAGGGIEIEDFTISVAKKHFVGEFYMDGIVFFIDHSGEHGLVASLDDLDGGSGVAWSDVTTQKIGENAKSATDGAGNTDAIIAQQISGSAAQLCRNLGPDWYLPSNREVFLLFSQEILIDQILDNDGDPNTNGLIQEEFMPTLARYWSSTEQDEKNAWAQKASSGDTSSFRKADTYRVRAIRIF